MSLSSRVYAEDGADVTNQISRIDVGLCQKFLPMGQKQKTEYCWFSHDVTKIQTKKLSILTRFYFHGALEQLKTNFHTTFRFERVLGFVIEYA